MQDAYSIQTPSQHGGLAHEMERYMCKTIVSVTLLCLLAAGCDQKSSVDQGASSPIDGAATPGPAKSSSVKALVLADNYTPTFALQVRSQRHEAAGAKFRHVVITEYLDMDAPEVIATIQSDLASHGFAVAAPVAHGDATRLVGKKEGLQFFADVHDSPTVELQAENARGIVSFTWMDGDSR